MPTETLTDWCVECGEPLSSYNGLVVHTWTGRLECTYRAVVRC